MWRFLGTVAVYLSARGTGTGKLFPYTSPALSLSPLCQAPPPPYHPYLYHPNSQSGLTGDCEGVRGAIPQLSWVLGEPGGLGTGDLSGLEPVGERGRVTPEQSGRQESRIRVLSVLTEPG